MTKLDNLLELIKVEYMHVQRPIALSRINTIAKDLYSKRDLPTALKVLNKEGKIKVLNWFVSPTNLDYLRNSINANREIDKPANREDILEIFRIYGSGTPSEIAQRYIELKGQANPETITRIIRFLFAEGVLNRRQDVYFTSEIKPLEKTLLQFV